MPETMEVEKIGCDVPVQEVYPSFVERYFTPRYVLDVHFKGDDICVLFHSNRVCLITLAPSHPIIVKGIRVVKVDFEASESEEDKIHKRRKHRNESTNRLSNKVSGKKKKGAQVLHKMSLLCKIELEDGSVYSIKSGIPGLLVEINELLIENPNMVVEKPTSEGYIAIMLPKTLESDKLRDRLMTPEQYIKAVEERNNPEVDVKSSNMKQDKEESTAISTQMEENENHSAVTVKMEDYEDSTAETAKVEPTKSTIEVPVKMDVGQTE